MSSESTGAVSTAATDVAVIGMACRFPGANNPGEFWELLRDGREARTELSDEALRAAGVPNALLGDPNYVKAGMFLQGMELFDAGFFGFSPLDARIMDPQHRHFLECAWEALEDAAYDPARYDGAIGVFAGSGHNAYLPYNLLTNPELVAEVGFFLLRHTGNDKDFLTTRASYCFDLKGPSVNIQTACSTSLVAVHGAAQSLINGECDMALAGGVTIEMPHRQGYLYKDSEILSRDGHCRPFDASAGGTLFGSGVGVLVLKRLDDALADGDHVHAVIKASAINNDGAGKVSYLAPSVDGQAAAIHEALGIGEIDPTTVTYVECHGTGTQLGDPIEVAALTQAYGADNPMRQYCGIGSVKSNIGHLDTAAGAASLIKVILSMQHRQLPATLHFRAPNAAIDFPNSPFYVNAQLREWTAASPLRAGVSSLGVGGTNAHVIVQEAPPRTEGGAGRAQQLLLLSARSDTSLLRSRDQLGRCLEDRDDLALADAAYTLAVGRRGFRRRAFAVVGDRREAVAALAGSEGMVVAETPDAPRKVAFMFAGGGAQYPNMGRELYESEPAYRAVVDECLQLLRGFVDFDLKPLLYPPAGQEAEAATALERPSRTLPALFITQYAQARLWQSWGVEPAALIGHSMGENTAACLAGIFSLRDALGLVALRGRLFETVGEGSMLSVELDEASLLPLLGSELSLGAINAPALTMASGPRAALARLEQTLAEREIGCRRIHIQVAAHSLMLEGILTPFGDYLRSIRLQAPAIPLISNLTGTWIEAAQATDPDYWVKHLRSTVRFADGVGVLLAAGNYALLEVGPGRTLTSLAGLQPGKRPEQAIIASLRHPDDDTPDLPHMLGALGRLWQAHVEIEWSGFYAGQERRRVSLPTYAFDHARCWIEPGATLSHGGGRDGAERSDAVEQWLYQPVWRRVAVASGVDAGAAGAQVLVLAGDHPRAAALIDALRGTAADMRVVQLGAALSLSGDVLRLRGDHPDDYVRVVEALQQGGWQPTHILNLLPLELGDTPEAGEARLVFDGLFHLAQAVANEDWRPLRWLCVSAGAMQVGGEAVRNPMASLALGPMRVLPREFPEWRCTLLDIDATLAPAAVVQELVGGDDEPLVARRGRGRYVQRHELRTDADTPASLSIRAGGVYLITGGTGGLGLVAAAALAQRQPDLTLYLQARRPLPERQYWDALIAADAPETSTLQQLLQLEAGGARVRLVAADVADEPAMRALAARIQAESGALHGIVHTAGAIADGLLLTKDFAETAAVLRPKVAGTLVLDRVFAGAELDFIALYSSTSAFSGLPGQIDYAAANAFLDAFAHYRAEQGAPYVALNWPAWKQAGMAAAMLTGATALPAGRPTAHPLLDRCVAEDTQRAEYATLFGVARHWLLAEHRIKDGPALVPGSGFIELARAAFVEYRRAPQDSAVTLRNVTFELPFFVEDDARKALAVTIEDDRFTISSDSFGDASVHAQGRVAIGVPLAETLDLPAVQMRCNRGVQTFDDPDHHPFLQFGERWRVLQQVRCGEREALIRLIAPPPMQAELAQVALHPALLDMATAGAQIMVEGYAPQTDLYVPVGYRDLQFNGALPASGYSHVVQRLDGVAAGELMFDVRVCDDSGAVVLRIDGFTMRRIPDVNSFRKALPATTTAVSPALKRTLELGIDNREGAAALLHVIERQLAPQTVVSPYRLAYLQRELTQRDAPETAAPAVVHDPDADAEIPGIEAVLRDCPALAQVVVRAFRDVSDERRLVAFFVPNFDQYVTPGELRRYARETLAAEQVPQQWVELDEMPGGANAERAQLHDPLAPKDTYAPPRTIVEKSLARIWQDALGVERVGLSDNFFDLGGHSLLSTRVIVQVYKKFGLRLDQATMVLHTLEQVAREIDERLGVDSGQQAAESSAPVATTEVLDETQNDKKKSLLKSWFGGKR